MSTTESESKAVISAVAVAKMLYEILDPEIGINIVDLGLIYGIECNKDTVLIVMSMTTPACPLGDYLQHQVETVVGDACPTGSRVDVDLVWTPAWQPAMMSEMAKHALGYQ